MDSSLANTSANSARFLGYISWGPIDLCTFRSLSNKHDLYLQWEQLCFPSPHPLERRQPIIEDWGKKIITTSAFFWSIVISFPALFIRGCTFFELPFLVNISVENLLLFFAWLSRFSLSLVLAFPTPSLHHWTSSLCPSQITCLCFHPFSICFFPLLWSAVPHLPHQSLAFPEWFLALGNS